MTGIIFLIAFIVIFVLEWRNSNLETERNYLRRVLHISSALVLANKKDLTTKEKLFDELDQEIDIYNSYKWDK